MIVYLASPDSFATLRDFWHGGIRQSLRRAGRRRRVAAIVRRAYYSEPTIPGCSVAGDRDPPGSGNGSLFAERSRSALWAGDSTLRGGWLW